MIISSGRDMFFDIRFRSKRQYVENVPSPTQEVSTESWHLASVHVCKKCQRQFAFSITYHLWIMNREKTNMHPQGVAAEGKILALRT